MQRREFLQVLGAGLTLAVLPELTLAYSAAPARYGRLLVLVELKGGNDGLNTVIPYASPDYARLRPSLAIARDQVLTLSERAGFHPSLAALMPLWQDGELALVEGVGYPEPNLSHFRSIEIWDTASASKQVLQSGWLSRQFHRAPLPGQFAADGVVLASQTLGPFEGGARVVVLNDPAAFAREAQLASDMGSGKAPGALAHILKVEGDIRHAAEGLAGSGTAALMAKRDPNSPEAQGKIPPPPGAFGKAVKTLTDTLARGSQVAVARLTLTGFDTHGGQLATQSRLLKELAEGLASLRSSLQAQGRWQDTLVMSYAEFGRRPRQNGNNGTDHGTANVHFVAGGAVKGGFYGKAPELAGISDGNLDYGVDFRQLYATALGPWWGQDAAAVLGERFEPVPLLRA